MPRSLVFLNNKGGVGKSTLAVNLSAAYAHAHPDKTVLFVDLTLTKSLARHLLGDAPPARSADLLRALGLRRATRRRALFWAASLFPFAAALSYVRVVPGTVALLALAALVWFRTRRGARVDVLALAATSTHAPNLRVLVGGETLVPAAGALRWREAVAEWAAPAADLVVFDLDNVLDDLARFATGVAAFVVVPASLNMFDFDRLCVDPRNGGLFEFLATLPAGRRPALGAVIFNRLRVVGGDDNGDFAVSAADRALQEELEARFAEKGEVGRFARMRELAPSVVRAMLDRATPVAFLPPTTQLGAALEAARGTLAALADAVM